MLIASDGPLVQAVRAQFPNTLAIYAFGSQIQGTSRPESDLDLAVLVAGYAAPLCFGNWLATWQMLQAALLTYWTFAQHPRSCNTRSSQPDNVCGLPVFPPGFSNAMC